MTQYYFRAGSTFMVCLLTATISRPQSPDPAPLLPTLRLQMDVQLALIPVHVTTPFGGAVTGLNRGNFHLFQDGVEQRITYFVNEDAPLSVGFLLDSSQSMKDKMEKSLLAANEFLKSTHPDDEFFLVEFNEHPRLRIPFTRDLEDFQRRMVKTKSLGRTSLLDAIDLGLRVEKKARNTRRAIVVLSDGGDNHSHHTEREIRKAVQEADVQIYTMGLFDPNAKSKEEQDGPRLLKGLAEDTGGKHFAVDSVDDLRDICVRVNRELRQQYLLGFTPDSQPLDGRYHSVKVALDQPGSADQFHVQYRPGYFAPNGLGSGISPEPAPAQARR